MRCAEHVARVGQRCGGRTVLTHSRQQALGQPEVRHPHPAATVEQDIAGLDVAVDDSLGPGSIQALDTLTQDSQRLLRWEPSFTAQALGQALALDVLHHHVVAARGLSQGVNPHNMRVLHRGHGPRLAQEAGTGILRLGPPLGNHLDGHPPSQCLLFGQKHAAHAPPAKQAQDLVARNLNTRRRQLGGPVTAHGALVAFGHLGVTPVAPRLAVAHRDPMLARNSHRASTADGVRHRSEG